MKKKLLVLFVFYFFSYGAFAQMRSISGTVISSDDNSPLPGVSVIIKGTIRGTSTDFDGEFKLDGIKESDFLVFNFIGYEDLEVSVGSKTEFSITLEVATNDLNEVVVTALGVKRQKREIGYSTDKVETDVIVRSSSPNVVNAIIGRSAGVQVSQSNGVDGGSTRVIIRGNNNLTGNNQPLIVVDNVPLDNTPGLENIGRGVDWGNGIADINPEDIETYNILKGGAASALYGSRGANGVILITTKRGKKQQGLGITYNFTHKVIQPYRYREVQNTYGAGGPISLSGPSFPMSGDTLLYPGVYGNSSLILNENGDQTSTAEEFGYYGSAVSWGPKMDGQMVRWWDGEMRAYSPQPDNYKSVYQNGSTQTHNISATGGNEIGTIRVSLTRQDHKSIIENSDFDRTTIGFGATMNISKKVKADVSMSYVKYNRLNSPMIGEEYNSFSKGYLYSWPRSYQGIDRQSYMNADGSRNAQEGYPFNDVDPYLWWNYYKNSTEMQRDKYFGALSLSYDITPWLNLLGRVGRDFSLEQYEARRSPTDVIGLIDGYYANSLKRVNSDIYEVYLTAEKELIPDLIVKFTAGANQWNDNRYGIGGRSGTWYYPNMYTFNNLTESTYIDSLGQIILQHPGDLPSDVRATEYIRQERNNSAFAFLNLSYKNYLFLELTGRNDWSSTLPEGNNSYFYPSISLSFVASDAFDIQKHIPWLNFVKIRGGIAKTATDAEPYQLDFYYGTGLFGGQQSSSFPDVIPPYNLKPQRVNSYETGINLGFFNNRIDCDFTYYYMYSYDQILPGLPIPTSSGAPAITTNEGIVTNRGWELNINAVPIRTKDILFRTGFNFYGNRNHVVSLGDDADIFPLADIWGLNGPAMALREGDEYGTIYGYDYVYHENGKPILDETGTHYLITDTRVPIGNASPDFLGGWSTSFSYKGFVLSTLIDAKIGGDIYAGSYVINLQTGQSPETLLEREGGGLPYTDPEGNTSNVGVVLDGVYEDGTPNDKVVHYYYKYLPNAGGWGKFLSTPGIVENSWVKMREVSLSYTIPEKLIRKTKVFQKLTLSIVGRDLFYIYTTLPDKINPEGIMGSGNAQGFEWASMPSTRSFTFGISASF